MLLDMFDKTVDPQRGRSVLTTRAQRQYNGLPEVDWWPLRDGSCFQLVPAILYLYTCTALQDMGAAYACL